MAEILSVCEDTVVGWENRGTIPAMRHMPTIIKMLGYFPINIKTNTFSGKITQFRFNRGMTFKEFGMLISADASTIRDWEDGKHIPSKRKKENIEALIKRCR